jgi:hypothetical protein
VVPPVGVRVAVAEGVWVDVGVALMAGVSVVDGVRLAVGVAVGVKVLLGVLVGKGGGSVAAGVGKGACGWQAPRIITKVIPRHNINPQRRKVLDIVFLLRNF